MAEVLAEQQPMATAVSAVSEGEGGKEEGGEEGEEGELAMELEEILKTCDQIQQTASGLGGGASEETEQGGWGLSGLVMQPMM